MSRDFGYCGPNGARVMPTYVGWQAEQVRRAVFARSKAACLAGVIGRTGFAPATG